MSDKPKKKVNVEHYCLKDNLKQFRDCEETIKALLNSKKPVPQKLLREYFGLLNAPENAYDAEVSSLAKHTRQKALIFFADRKNYHFNKQVERKYKHPFGWDEQYQQVYSLGDLIEGICVLLEAYLQLIGDATKEMVISFTYSHIKEYLAEIPDKNPLSEYQTLVITGFVTAYMGFNLTEEEFNKNQNTFGQYTQYLADSVKYLVKKTKNKSVVK